LNKYGLKNLLVNINAATATVLQVQYSLLYRKPETNGVFEACKEAGVTLVAYSPLCQGLLTGDGTLMCDRGCQTAKIEIC
jgi:aryl-alcohol dehydrogenase-like predicted oxidoreductase